MNQFSISMLDSTPKTQKSKISRIESPSKVELISVMTLLDMYGICHGSLVE